MLLYDVRRIVLDIFLIGIIFVVTIIDVRSMKVQTKGGDEGG
jgi:hypothetical protein